MTLARRAAHAVDHDPCLDGADSLTALAGLGPARAASLRSMGIGCLRDLLLTVPAAIEVGQAPVPISEALARVGETLMIEGRVESWKLSRFGRRSLLRVRVADGSGSLDVSFFNQPWLRERFQSGELLCVRGRVGEGRSAGLLASKLDGREHPLPRAGEVGVVYASPPGLSSQRLAAFIAAAWEAVGERLVDPLTAEQRTGQGLLDLNAAVRALHWPADAEQFERGRKRVLLESLLGLQARLAARHLDLLEGQAPRVELDEVAARELFDCFPFELTGAQSQAVGELRVDLARRTPMRRLLQGDVGSGKTAVGAWACLAVARAGWQAAFMAPTELLAEQHRAGLSAWMERAGVRSASLTGSMPSSERRAVLGEVHAGRVDVLFGTHALFSKDVEFARLALAVIDEQHRFGVAQRRRLLEKGRDVHALLMTATPIPRSLALTLYGDLEVSVLREKPPGRGVVRTRWLRGAKRRGLKGWLDGRLAEGEQAYWVVPRIEAGEGKNALGAEERCAHLLSSKLARHGVELVHGRLEGAERERRLARFRSGETRLLVATTVIEVGVDVPAASVMVIEEAQRLGLAQLHQLRGRVGRGAADSWCFLLGDKVAAERFAVLEGTGDGFEIAEEDLRRRGMGDLVGLRQAGAGAQGSADPTRDLALLFAARDMVRADPRLRQSYLRTRR